MKKKHIKRITALLLVLLLFAGCAQQPGKTPEETETTAETEPVETEAVPVMQKQESDTYGLAYEPDYGLNPYSCNCLTNRPIISLAYEGLFCVNSSFQAEPVLCDSFAVSEDGLTYLFSIREDAVFSTGEPVTAEDAVASLRESVGSKYYGNRLNFISGISEHSERILKISLKTPYENLPLLLDIPIVKKGTEDRSIPTGSGPYVIYPVQNCMKRNLNWWQGVYRAIPNDRIELQTGKTPTDIRDSFEFGSTNLILADLNSASKVGYRCDYELWTCSTTVMQYVGFNTVSGVCANRTFRRAVGCLIDRETVCSERYQGLAVPAVLPCSPESTLYDETLAGEYSFNTTEFYRQAAESGVSKDGKIVILVWSGDATRVELANDIADSLERYSYGASVQAVDYDSYKARLNKGEFDMYIGEVRLSANFDLSQFFAEDGSMNFGGISNREIYDLCIETLKNSGSSYELYSKIAEYALLCPILFKTYSVMVTRGKMSNVQPALDNVFHLPGGRSLVSAGVTYEELNELPKETSETETQAAG